MIFGDFETTGLLVADINDLTNQPYITEIYFVKLEWNQEKHAFDFISEMETFVKPRIPVSEEITKITGITNEMISNAPSFASLYPKIRDFFLGETTFVAHNVAFEIGMLRAELARLGREYQFPWPYNQICTVERSMPIQNKRMTLGKLHEYFYGTPHEGAHRSRTDVEALVRVYSKMMEYGLV